MNPECDGSASCQAAEHIEGCFAGPGAASDFDLRQLGEIIQAVEELPDDVRAELARGPLDDPGCRICMALTKGRDDEIIAFHEAGDAMLHDALTDTIGVEQRPTADVVAEADRLLAGRRGHPMAWTAVDALADQLAFMRCLFVYMIAGWKP